MQYPFIVYQKTLSEQNKPIFKEKKMYFIFLIKKYKFVLSKTYEYKQVSLWCLTSELWTNAFSTNIIKKSILYTNLTYIVFTYDMSSWRYIKLHSSPNVIINYVMILSISYMVRWFSYLHKIKFSMTALHFTLKFSNPLPVLPPLYIM